MSDDLSLELWSWYATDEFKLVLQVCELSKALELLARPPSEQSSMIPYCPACEAWSNMILPVNDFLESFPAKISVALRQKLEVLWEMSNALSQDAFHCDDFEIFHHSEWERLRVEADAALQMIGWDTLKDQVDELMLECRKALYPHFYQGKT